MNLRRIAKILEEDRQLLIREEVLRKAEKENQIIYGARAINQQVPTYLRRETKDYDVLTKKPKKTAKELVKELNRRIGREEFKVIKAQHKGTYKIKDSKGETVVDYTQLKRVPKVKSSFGNKFYHINSIKRNLSKSMKKPQNAFRKEKDLDTLDRIKLSESNFILN